MSDSGSPGGLPATGGPLAGIRIIDLSRLADSRFEPATWPGLAQVIGDRFATASRDEWAARFAGVDACVTPVLAPGEVLSSGGPPQPVPRFCRTPGERGRDGGVPDATAEVLAQAGLSDQELRAVAEGRAPRWGVRLQVAA